MPISSVLLRKSFGFGHVISIKEVLQHTCVQKLKSVVQEVLMLHNTHIEINGFEFCTSSTRHI